MYRSKLKLLLLCCCLMLAGRLFAQDASYFVYIQHEKQQPFYVKMNGKVISSSARGYVILPKMPQGKVPVTIGFLKDQGSEQAFSLRITGQRDYGYLLKDNGEKEYALYDLQTFATLKSGGLAPVTEEAAPPAQEQVSITRISDSGASAETKAMMDSVQKDVQAVLAKQPDSAPGTGTTAKKNGFAEALDRVVKDDRPDDMPMEAVKPRPVAPPPPPVEEEVATVTEQPSKKRSKKKQREEAAALSDDEKALLSSVMEDEKKAAADEALKDAPAETVVEDEPEMKKEEPKKEKKKKRKDNEPEFIDFTATGGPATAGGAVAEEKSKAKKEEEVTTTEEGAPEVSAKEARELKRQQKKAEREAADRAAFVKDSIANAEFAVIPGEEKKAEKKEVKMVNSDCPNILEVDAFRKLLRTMNSKKSDEDMVDAFRKGTRAVCVSTEQVRALAQLIATEENRYQLLDAAYPRTYDSQNFLSLADLLKEDYYKGRFRAMVKK